MLAHGRWFSFRVLRLLPPLKTDHHDIAEILLKVALSTINQNLNLLRFNEILTLDVVIGGESTSVLNTRFNNAAHRLYVMVGVLRTCGKHFHDYIISLRQRRDPLIYINLDKRACTKLGELVVMYLCVRESNQFCIFLLFFYWILEMFRQWYFFIFFWSSKNHLWLYTSGDWAHHLRHSRRTR